MQDLVIIKNNRVIVQNERQFYEETFENFRLDGGASLPKEILELDYNRSNESCWINGKAFQRFPNKYAEEVLASIDKLVSNKEKREYEEAQQQEAELLANMTQEEKDALALQQAKEERAQTVAQITVEVDGMLFKGDENAIRRMANTVSIAMARGFDLETKECKWVLANGTIANPTVMQLARACELAADMQTEAWVVPYES